MLDKSLSSNSDMIIYDLEDSVSPSPVDKLDARNRLAHFLNGARLPDPRRVAVNSGAVHTLILPKIHSAQDLHHVSSAVNSALKRTSRATPFNIVPSIESAKASFNLGEIASWKSKAGATTGGRLSALLRFGKVCVNYKDFDYLRDECTDGRQLGFTGKILRAARILHGMEAAHAAAKGAVGLEGEMIDAPMLKQFHGNLCARFGTTSERFGMTEKDDRHTAGHASKTTKNLTTPDTTGVASGLNSFPSSPNGFKKVLVASIVALAIQRLSSAR
ncbi:hypothetical protein DXG01_008745 [Tephrocybe rancida]|nr:hypothetical protein DXG01_008745 [Tephrocybe rancida]